MEIKSLIEYGIIFVGAVGFFFTLRNSVDHLKEEDQKQWDQIAKLRDWVTVHERDEATSRLDLERDMGRIREDASKAGGKMDTLISMITELTKKIERLELRLESKT